MLITQKTWYVASPVTWASSAILPDLRWQYSTLCFPLTSCHYMLWSMNHVMQDGTSPNLWCNKIKSIEVASITSLLQVPPKSMDSGFAVVDYDPSLSISGRNNGCNGAPRYQRWVSAHWAYLSTNFPRHWPSVCMNFVATSLILGNTKLMKKCRCAPNWSADRIMNQFPEFMNVAPDSQDPIYFTGEMVDMPKFLRATERKLIYELDLQEHVPRLWRAS